MRSNEYPGLVLAAVCGIFVGANFHWQFHIKTVLERAYKNKIINA